MFFFKNLPPLKKRLSKRVQKKDDKINSNLQTTNHNLNDWKLQIHRNILEWVNKRRKISGKKPIQLLQINTILINMIEQLNGLAVQN